MVTLQTLKKIEILLEKEGRPVTKHYLSKKFTIHYAALKKCFEELERQGKIKKVDTSTNGELWVLNYGK